MECRASDEEDPGTPHPHETETIKPHDLEQEPEAEDDETPIRGAILPQESIERDIRAFQKHLGFKDPEPKPTGPRGPSALMATNASSGTDTIPFMPVDTACFDRFEAVAARKRWSPFPMTEQRSIHVQREVWEALFKTPMIPQEACDKTKTDQGSSGSTIFRDSLKRKLEEELTAIDNASYSGLKFALVFMLIGELLMRFHQQLPDDPDQVSRKEASHLMLLLGPLS